MPKNQVATDVQQRFGLGIKVAEIRPSHSLSSLIMIIAEPKQEGASLYPPHYYTTDSYFLPQRLSFLFL